MTEPAEATAAAAAAAASAASAASAAPWHGIADTETAAYITTKGWSDLPSVVKSYREAEKYIGRDPATLVSLPKEGDEAGYTTLMQKLGLPEKADAYDVRVGLPKEIEIDKDFGAQVQQMFHKAGLTQTQANKLAAQYNAYTLNKITQSDKDARLNLESDKRALLSEWKGGHERMVNAAKAAVKAFELDQKAVDAIETALGYSNTMKLFAGLGMKLGEDKFVGSGDAASFNSTMTPAEAKVAWESMKADPGALAALRDPMHPSNEAAKKKQKDLFQIMYPTER